MDEKRMAAGQKLLDAAFEFWRAAHEEDPRASGAVLWLEGSNGELLIFTRGEYRQTLMSNIHSLPGNKVHFSGVK